MELSPEQLESLRIAFHVESGSTPAAELTKEEYFLQLLSAMGIEEELPTEQAENIAYNYIYLNELVKKDLTEINTTLEKLKQMETSTPASEDYQHKKIRYFAKLNREAKDDIESFYTSRLLSFVLENRNKKWKDTGSKGDELGELFLKMRYDYSFFRHYYDIDYDFSTEAKIRFLPGVDIMHMRETVDEFIALKSSDVNAFNVKIGKIVSENKCIEYIRDHVASNFYMHKRLEIFQTLVELYERGKYQSYIALAMIELEGIFADCCDIIAKEEKENAGTLIEKAEKVFNNVRLKQAIYPYYAFELPILRNEIAHKGMTSEDSLEGIANELTLDLYTAVYWTEHYSNDKFLTVLCAFGKLNAEDRAESEESTTFCELFSCYQTYDREFLMVLADPAKYDDELQFFRAQNSDPCAVTILEMVQSISTIVKSESFWKYIADDVLSSTYEHKQGKPYDVIDFITALRNMIIPVLTKDSSEKLACQEVSKKLKTYGC